MWCPRCGKDTRVVETDKLLDTVTRVRWCRNKECRHLFQTYEVIKNGPAPGPGEFQDVRTVSESPAVRD